MICSIREAALATRFFVAVVFGALAVAPLVAAQEKPAAWALPPEERHSICFDCGMPPPAVAPKASWFARFLPARPRLNPDSKPIPPHHAPMIDGETGMSMCVEMDGDVTSLQLTSSAGDERFDQASLAWMQTMTFEPSRWFGLPVRKCGHSVTVAWMKLVEN
jgi:TonB family protein